MEQWGEDIPVNPPRHVVQMPSSAVASSCESQDRKVRHMGHLGGYMMSSNDLRIFMRLTRNVDPHPARGFEIASCAFGGIEMTI
jgi:hypothetical protein